MGYDKPDLGFVVHYQAPGSVITYYQQVGRAGRGVDHADVVLLRGAEDRRIQDFFIEQAFPRARARRPRARGAGRGGGGGPVAARPDRAWSTWAAGGWRRCSRCSTSRARWSGSGAAGAARDGQRLALRRRPLRRGDGAAAARAGGHGGVRRRRPLPHARAAGGARRSRAARTAGAAPSVRARASRARSTPRWCARPRCTCARGRSCWRSRRWRPAPTARCASCPTTCARRRGGRSRGWATAAGTRWCRRAGGPGASTTSWSTPPPRPCAAGARPSPGWPPVPSHRSGPLVPDLAARLARALGVPCAPVLERVRDGAPQREMANSAQQVANVRGAFAVTGELPPGPVPAGRRRALQRLDARDAGRAAAPARRARGLSAGADLGRVVRAGRGPAAAPGKLRSLERREAEIPGRVGDVDHRR